MQQAPTKKDLEQKINVQKLPNDKKLYYSLAKKQRSLTGSLFGKDIILIFCPEDNSLFYVKEGHKLPFLNEANIQKTQIKDIAAVTRSDVSNPPGSNTLVIKYPKKDDKGKQSLLEWKIDMANKGVAQGWVTMISDYKNEKAQPIKPTYGSGIRPGPSNVNPTNNNTTPAIKNQGNPPPPTGQVNKQKQNEDPMQFLLTDSRVILNKQDEDVLNYYITNPDLKSKPPVNKPQVIAVPSVVNPPSNKPANNSANNMANTQINNDIPYETIIKINGQTYNNPKPKPPPPQMNQDQSRLSIAYEATSRIISPADSRTKPENPSAISNDWNFKFVKDPTRETVLQFEEAAIKAFQSSFQQSINPEEQVYVAQVSGLLIQIADNFTPFSRKLKQQYRNYHYILDSCKLQPMILNVPLTCLIEYQGKVGLIKARLPRDAIQIKNKRDLQNILADLQPRTKISNTILFGNRCVLYDLTKIYGSYGQSPRIYVDNLDQFMPEFNAKNKQKDEDNLFYVRPQLLQYFGNRIVPGGSMDDPRNVKVKGQFTSALENQIKDIAQILSAEQIYIANYADLKQFLHSRGVNMKFLHRIYMQTKNKFAKKYLQTCLVAKIIKDCINQGFSIVLLQSKISPQEYVQEQIRLFMEGKTAATNEYWKKISMEYRNLYGTSMNTHELLGGFLLSCLMALINADYNMKYLNKEKIIFKDQGIIGKGFVNRLLPKIKSYYRFSSKIVETIEICKYSQKNQGVFNQLVDYMSLKTKQIPYTYNVHNGKQYILGYLSDFVPAKGFGQETLPCAQEIYSLVNAQPPNAPTLKITLSYINQWLKTLKNQRNSNDQKLEDLMRESIQTINYWLQFQHPIVCEFYEKVSSYEQYCGDTEESLKILEKAIEIAYRTEGRNSKKIGMRHYVAGCQYLKAGRKKQAIDNLQKAKGCMQRVQGLQSEHALVLMKLSSLQLNNGDTDSCIKLGKQALKNAQKGNMADSYIIKICQILCRAYEIKGQKQQLRKLSMVCARDFNKTQDKYTFSQMVKICLTGTITKLSLQRSKSLLTLSNKLKQDSSIKDENQSTISLMQKAKSMIVMQNFMMKSDNVDKYLGQYTSKKQLSADGAQYISTLALVAGCVGIDFIEGLHAQKEYE